MLSGENKNWNLLSVYDKGGPTSQSKCSCSARFPLDKMRIWLICLCPSSLQKALQPQGRDYRGTQQKTLQKQRHPSLASLPCWGAAPKTGRGPWTGWTQMSMHSLTKPRTGHLLGTRKSPTVAPKLSNNINIQVVKKTFCLKKPKGFYPVTSFQLKAVVHSQPKS